MTHDALKDLLYGGLLELIQNKKYFYHSAVSAEYSHWTEAGEDAMSEFMNIMAFHMAAAESIRLDARAKELVMDGLTK
tara:strand:+ start:586 stop:819 length:234 start_codon:yes stop_codon:yes gene_type:complete